MKKGKIIILVASRRWNGWMSRKQIITLNTNAINIVYSGNEATVGNLPSDGSVTATKSGADVTISSSSTGLVEIEVSGGTSKSFSL